MTNSGTFPRFPGRWPPWLLVLVSSSMVLVWFTLLLTMRQRQKEIMQDGNLRLCLRRRSMKLTTNGHTMTKATVGMFQLVRRRHQRDVRRNNYRTDQSKLITIICSLPLTALAALSGWKMGQDLGRDNRIVTPNEVELSFGAWRKVLIVTRDAPNSGFRLFGRMRIVLWTIRPNTNTNTNSWMTRNLVILLINMDNISAK